MDKLQLLSNLKQAAHSTNKKLLACFPLYPPVELFHAAGFTPIVLWGLKESAESLNESDRHLQSYACSVSRHLLQFLLSGPYKELDGIFYYNACDTLRNLPEILAEGLNEKGATIPFYAAHIPAGGLTHDCARKYFKEQIAGLSGELKNNGHSFTPADFRESIELYNNIKKLYRDFEGHVRRGEMSYITFTETIAAGNFSLPEAHLAELQKISAAFTGRETNHSISRSQPGILISGILPPSPEIIAAIEEAGLRIAGNDVATQRRSYGHIPEPHADPFDFYASYYENRCACPTLLYTADRRIEELNNYVEETEARGIIFVGEKFCEYEYLEYPYLEKLFKAKNIPTLTLELTAEDSPDPGALKTRIEAFAELLTEK